MKFPDPNLTRAYGTDDVFKSKLANQLPLSARVALGYFNMSRTQADDDHQYFLRMQAEEMNRQLAAARAVMMQPVISHMQHTRVPAILTAGRVPGMMSGQDVPLGMDDGMIRLAHAATFAVEELERTEKEAGVMGALGTVLGRATGKTIKGVKNLAGGAVTKVKDLQLPKINAPKSTSAPAQLARTQPMQAVKTQPMTARTQPMSAQPVAKTQKMKPLTGQVQPPPGARPGGTGTVSMTSAATPATPTAGAVQGPKSPPQAMQAQPSAPGASPPTKPTVSTPQNPTSLTDKAKQLWEHSGLSNDRWKWKVPAMALGAGLTYGAFKGIKGATHLMSEKSGPEQFNQGGATPAYGINEWGQPDRNMPIGG